MNKNIIVLIFIVVFSAGCTSIDERGFYLAGRNKDYNKFTGTNLDKSGYDKSGYDKRGWNKEGKNKETGTDYDKAGYDKLGYDEKGYNSLGLDKGGYNKDGYNKQGYDINGYSKDGWSKEGINKITKTNYDENGYDKEGYNKEGYDKEGNDRNYIGIWEIRYYVDEFKELTKEAYISNKKWINGTFSNSATTDSLINVLFLIDKEKISIQLFEYGSRVVTKGNESYYDVFVQDKEGNKEHLTATNYGDRLILAHGKFSDMEILHKTLQQEGEIKFAITAKSNYSNFPSKYFFIINSKGYKNAYQQLFK